MTTDYEKFKQAALDDLANAESDYDNPQYESYHLGRAQTYATLALAAATRANRTVTVREDRP